jgi:hypothetical protein
LVLSQENVMFVWLAIAVVLYLACQVHNRLYLWGKTGASFKELRTLYKDLMPRWHAIYHLVAFNVLAPVGTLVILVEVLGMILVSPGTNVSKYVGTLRTGYYLSDPKRKKRFHPDECVGCDTEIQERKKMRNLEPR